MLGANVPAAAIVFVALAVIFLGAALRDSLLAEGKLTPARKTWLRVSFIFSGVAIGLFVWHSYLS
jgi:hypothetical protein